ncbi:hypothetical protein [Pseudaestuariivita rosea]|uniref:hypothetical protein n=1 Tax=Pseudaestuariivita rosea TaxID=2763263 RepID=UPI001ABBCC5E|nr:hypothetical protein [Pseudaestuariivita rosea]
MTAFIAVFLTTAVLKADGEISVEPAQGNPLLQKYQLNEGPLNIEQLEAIRRQSREQASKGPQPSFLSGPPWPDCIALHELSSDKTPPEISGYVISCLLAGEAENAAHMIVAEYFSYHFDRRRLGLSGFTPYMLQDQRSRYFPRSETKALTDQLLKRVNATRFEEPEYHRYLCEAFQNYGPPTYDIAWIKPWLVYENEPFNLVEYTDNTSMWMEHIDRLIRCDVLRE